MTRSLPADLPGPAPTEWGDVTRSLPNRSHPGLEHLPTTLPANELCSCHAAPRHHSPSRDRADRFGAPRCAALAHVRCSPPRWRLPPLCACRRTDPPVPGTRAETDLHGCRSVARTVGTRELPPACVSSTLQPTQRPVRRNPDRPDSGPRWTSHPIAPSPACPGSSGVARSRPGPRASPRAHPCSEVPEHNQRSDSLRISSAPGKAGLQRAAPSPCPVAVRSTHRPEPSRRASRIRH